MRRSGLLLAALAVAAVAAPAAALMLEVPMTEMVSTSTAIVRAHVTDLRSYWVASPHVIRTDVTLDVAEVWKGGLQAHQPLVVQVEGGKVGDMSMQVEHQPDLRPGDDVVLFLRATPAARFVINNDEQGRYSVLGDQVKGVRPEPTPLATFRATVARLVPTGTR